MRVSKSFGIAMLSVSLSMGWTGLAGAQDAPAAAGEQPKPAEAQPARAAQPAADAQEGRGAREGRGGARRIDPARMLERMQASFADLNLSEDQKAKIQGIIDKAKPQVKAALKETEGKEPRERMTKFRETMQPIRDELMGVLDETQRQRLREKTQAARGERRRGAGAPPTIERLKATLAQLELSDDQQKQVDALLADAEKQFAAIRAEADKAGGAGEARGKFRELMQSNRKRLNEILTAEQQQKLRELSPRRAGGRGERGGQGGQGGAPAPTETPREPL